MVDFILYCIWYAIRVRVMLRLLARGSDHSERARESQVRCAFGEVAVHLRSFAKTSCPLYRASLQSGQDSRPPWRCIQCRASPAKYRNLPCIWMPEQSRTTCNLQNLFCIQQKVFVPNDQSRIVSLNVLPCVLIPHLPQAFINVSEFLVCLMRRHCHIVGSRDSALSNKQSRA